VHVIYIAIDLNVRLGENKTYSGFENVVDVSNPDFLIGSLGNGREVWVWEEESGATARGKITSVDFEARLVYLDVQWDTLTVY